MLSNVTYPSLSGTSVFTDFVELPSQLYEHWQEQPQVLQQLRQALPDRRAAAGRPAEALPRCAQVQPGLCHGGVRLLGADRPRIPHPAGFGLPPTSRAFEKKELEKIGMPEEIALRHRPTAVRPHLLRRSLCVRLLQLHVVRGDGRRRLRRLRGGRRHLRSRHWPSGCMTTSIRRAARSIRRRPISPSAAARRSRMRCCAGAGLLEDA